MSNLVFGTVFIASLILILALWLRQKRGAERKQGLKLLQALRMMLKHLQLHRGLTAIYLAGDKTVLQNLKSAGRSISEDLNMLASMDADLIATEDWQGMSSHWARLSVAASRYGVYENYDQHSKLIHALLEQIRGLIHGYGLSLRSDSGSREPVFWYELLCMGEKLGQLRALGVICLSQSNYTNGAARLNQLCRTKVIDGIGELEHMLKGRSLQVKLGARTCENIKDFLVLAELDIGQNQLVLGAKEYFDKASAALDLVYRVLDDEMQRLVRAC